MTVQRYELRDTLVRLQDIGLSFDGKVILRNINAEVRDIVRPDVTTGQIVGILGPSGVGKTQLSRILTGLQAPTVGTVMVGNKSTPLEAGVVGYVPQNYPLLRHRTVLSNLILAARRSGLSEKAAEEKAMNYLRMFSLEDRWDFYPVQLSGGQRQRVCIMQQLLCSEHYLVLDEPTTGLDPLMKDKTCDLIRKVASMSEENTIFVVSHDIASVLTMADQLWLLGRDRDEKGCSLGATIKYSYNLIERGIAWDEAAQKSPQFVDLQREIRAAFETL